MRCHEAEGSEVQNSKVKRDVTAVFPATKDRCRGEADKLLHAHCKQYEMHFSCCPYGVDMINSSNKYLDWRLGKGI